MFGVVILVFDNLFSVCRVLSHGLMVPSWILIAYYTSIQVGTKQQAITIVLKKIYVEQEF